MAPHAQRPHGRSDDKTSCMLEHASHPPVGAAGVWRPRLHAECMSTCTVRIQKLGERACKPHSGQTDRVDWRMASPSCDRRCGLTARAATALHAFCTAQYNVLYRTHACRRAPRRQAPQTPLQASVWMNAALQRAVRAHAARLLPLPCAFCTRAILYHVARWSPGCWPERMPANMGYVHRPQVVGQGTDSRAASVRVD